MSVRLGGRLGGHAVADLDAPSREDEEAREVVGVVLDAVLDDLEAVHLGRARRGDGGRVAQALLAHDFGGAGRVVRGHWLDAFAL